MKQKLTKTGYLTVHLRTGGEKHLQVHRLVAKAFIPNPENKPQVNHIDGDKTNNNVENLEWVTASENMLHAISTGLYTPPDITLYGKKGSEHGGSKLSEDDVKTIRKLRASGRTLISIAKDFNLGTSQVHRITNGESWRYLDD